MSKIADFVGRQAEKITEALGDGLQVTDLPKLFDLVAGAVEITTELDTVAEQREAAEQLCALVLELTDTPYLPDKWSDPAMLAGFRLLLPRLIPDRPEVTS